MVFRLPSQIRQRLFSTATRVRNTVPTGFYNAASASQLSNPAASVPKLGRIGKWYLPTMAAIAVGMIYIPSSLFAPAPGRRTVTLDEANRQIGFSIMNHLDQHNKRANGMTQEERNQLLMEAYGERSSLEDMERAIAGLDEVNRRAGPNERNDVLEEAYGSRTSLKDIRRAMEIYEVQ